MRLCILLAGLAARVSCDGVAVVVRNLVGEDVLVSWLQPGQEPRQRVPQQVEPVKNATVVSIHSYTTHEFIIASVPPRTRSHPPSVDVDGNCSYWASIGECEANPRYMLANCARSCAASAATSAVGYHERSVTFAVSDMPEVISVVVAADGVWTIERSGSTQDARAAVESAYGHCKRDAQCVSPVVLATCVRDALVAWHAPRLHMLDVERALFLDALAAVPSSGPDPEAAGTTDAEDVESIHASYARAASPLKPMLEACYGNHACVEMASVAAAVAVTNAVAAAQRGTRRRGQERRNATCAAHVATSLAVSTTAWKYEPGAASAIWGGTPPPLGPLEPERRVRHLFKPDAIPAALIALVDDFVSGVECDAIVTACVKNQLLHLAPPEEAI